MAEYTSPKRPSRLNDIFESPPVPCKTFRADRSPAISDPKEYGLKTSRIKFEYGPPELNLYINVAKNTLWRKAKEKFVVVTDEGEPIHGLFVIHGSGDHILENCMKMFDFDQDGDHHNEAGHASIEERDTVCVIYIEETFRKSFDVEIAKALGKVTKNVKKSNLFIMVVSDIEIKKAIKFCEKYRLCHPSHILSQSSDREVFYEAFYNLLDKSLTTFSSELSKLTLTRNVCAIKYQLDSLIEKLRSRKKKTKSALTNQCLEILRGHVANNSGIVGYRLIGEELYIFESVHETLKVRQEKRTQIENSIITSFKGKIHFRSFNDVFKPHCPIRCGGYLQNKRSGFMGTIGMFGSYNDTGYADLMQTVAIASPHVISSGSFACLPGGENFGECIWPDKPENIHDVSIIKIDTSCLNSLQTSILKARIQIKEISRDILNDRRVIKYGAATEKTVGWIEKIDDFEIYGSDVLVIITEDIDCPFSAQGDSGAIVLTKIHGEYHGIGMIYGGELNLRNSENISIQNETIAIFLKNALDRFEKDKRKAIRFDKI